MLSIGKPVLMLKTLNFSGTLEPVIFCYEMKGHIKAMKVDKVTNINSVVHDGLQIRFTCISVVEGIIYQYVLEYVTNKSEWVLRSMYDKNMLN